MPSKGKKQSKSRLSSSEQFPSSPSASSSTSYLSNSRPNSSVPEYTEEELLSCLKEASSKYPSLIGPTALIGRVTESAPHPLESKGCTIWLSESAMVAASIAPGSTVSVSLVPPRKTFLSFNPLSSLPEECASHFGFSHADTVINGAGNFFALATAFPSCKVVKNEVRLSLKLSSTMGCPASGRIVFVYYVNSRAVAGLENGNGKLHTFALGCLSVCSCKELYLSLISSKSGFAMNNKFVSQTEFSTETNQGRLEDGYLSSPMTPSIYRSKISSPCTGQETASEVCELKTPNPSGTSFYSFDVNEALEDGSVKKLLQTCCTSWLFSRNLLCGNFVTIPILAQLCIFQVIGANSISGNNCVQDLTDKRNYDLSTETSNLEDVVNDAFCVDRETRVYLYPSSKSGTEVPLRREKPCLKVEHEQIKGNVGSDFLKLGGLSKECAVLKDVIISSAVKGTLSSVGLRPTKGVLLHGPPGTGKTSLARLCAHETGIKLFFVNGPEIVSQYYGESEQALIEVFNSASRDAPAVVFIDELDSLAPARKDGGEELSQRIVATLLNLMDGINRTDGLLVIAATNRPDCIEPALRRPGRLDREIEIGVPSPMQRYDILLAHLTDMEHSLSNTDIHYLATVTHGFVGADLAALCNEAALVCLRRYVNFKMSCDHLHCNGSSIAYDDCSGDTEDCCDCVGDATDLALGNTAESASLTTPGLPISGVSRDDDLVNIASMSQGNILSVALEDFEQARVKVRPSAMREVILEVPKVKWEDVGGQKEVKMQLMEAVEWPQKHQDAFKRIGTHPPTGVLMFGPPGCSKTLLARAVASEAGLNFLAVKGPELFSKWVGESEKAVRALFAKARANAPSIIFFDEIDSLAVIRGKESDGVSVADRVMSQLLVELDGLHQRVDVTVIAATNRPDKIDPALLRPGRFDRLLYVGPPDEADREDIFRVHLRKMPCNTDVCVKELALLTDGCTGADISLVCREAAVAAIEENLDASEITMKHLKAAINQVQPSEIHSYQHLSTKFQRLVLSTARRDDLGHRPHSYGSSQIPFWTRIKSIISFANQLLAALSR